MNDNAKAWVQALRSGEFRQGKNALHLLGLEESYCCLGVACELFLKTYPDALRVTSEYINAEVERIHYNGESSILPPHVQQWLGLATREGSYDEGMRALSADNDTGSTFDEIANIIESEPSGLFS